MIELKYKGWSKMPINTYQQIREVLKSDDKDDEKTVRLISVLTGLDIDDVMDLKLVDFERLANDILFVFTPLPKHHGLFRTLTIDGERYDVQTDFSKITTAQYMDFNTFYEDPEKYYTNILTTFILPHGKKYNDGYDASELAKVFGEKLDIVTAHNASAFFLTWSANSIKIIQGMYARRVKRMAKREKDPQRKETLMKIVDLFQGQRKLIDGLTTSMQ